MAQGESQAEKANAPPAGDRGPADAAVDLAAELLRDSLAGTRRGEAARMARIATLIEHPQAKQLSLEMTDRVFRCGDAVRAAEGWRDLLGRVGIADGLPWTDRLMLRCGELASRLLPWPVMASVRARLRLESRGVILPAEESRLTGYLQRRRTAGARINLNQLGEAVLGEEEATRRLESVLALLARHDVSYVSVKISAIYSQIDLVAWDDTLEAIKDRLRRLYRAAMPEGKFVNLDMEEYRDLALTVTAFREVLDEEEFRSLSAGLVLQAYLPDSILVQEDLTAWARERRAGGGAPIKIRLVKGANLAMERVEAEWHGWQQACHPDKATTDAGFKRMLEFGCRPENAAAVRLGIGSHNLFDIALALELRRRNGIEDFVSIEMLEGMAPAQARAVNARAEGLLFYAPLVHRRDFGSALAYLIRRLDENTSPGNFLSELFSLRPGSEGWQRQKQAFLAAWEARGSVPTASHRDVLPITDADGEFRNQPDSDWTRPENRRALASARACVEVPPRAGVDEIETALAAATKARPEWEARGEEARAGLLFAVAEHLAATRFESIALLREEAHKAVAEADSEISEAIDFARYYAASGRTMSGLRSEALGTVAVVPPWNFPFAIPCGGVLAALIAGNAVILKPAPESVRIGWWLARQLWKAGIPRDVLGFVACDDGEVGRGLIEDERIAAVILTGAYATARKFQSWRPSLRLFAETSGKNAIVVSALADRELAARDLVRSAFGHSGQKCSAASLGILEDEVYDDPVFRRQLRDAAASLRVGPAGDPASVITPLVQAPGEDLERALTRLDAGEEWLLEPRRIDLGDDGVGDTGAGGGLWSPGIRLGVEPGSWFHRTECFGPVMGLMRASDLDEAVAMQNEVSFGLTAGFHSLDKIEIAAWKDRVQAGNLYINRGITGAIVRRQPFGGWKQSGVGPGAKAGGPNYVSQLRRHEDVEDVDLEEAERSYRAAWDEHFRLEQDPSGLSCESNAFRYRRGRVVVLWLLEEDRRSETLAGMAADVCGADLHLCRELEAALEVVDASTANRAPVVLRSLGVAPPERLLRAAAEAGVDWIDEPLSTVGRLELCRWLREQSVSETRHRYGNVFETTESPSG